MSRSSVRVFAPLLALLAVSPVLAQGEVPIPFASPLATPHVIPTSGVPGAYLVVSNLYPTPAAAPGSIIDIDCSQAPPDEPKITLDLNGMVLSKAGNTTDSVITVFGTPNCEVVIRDGIIVGGRHGIRVPLGIRKITIEDVTISDSDSDGVHILDTQNIVFRRNTVINTGGRGLRADLLGGEKTITIVDSHFRNIGADGIFVFFAASVEISNNRVSGVTDGIGISVAESVGCLLSQNTVVGVSGSPSSGIAVFDGTCKLNNNVVDIVEQYGILLSDTVAGSLVLDNTVRRAGLDGIRIEGSRNHIERNLGVENGGFGMFLGPGSFENSVGRNTAVGNAGGACLGIASPPDYCDDAAASFTFGDNLFTGTIF